MLGLLLNAALAVSAASSATVIPKIVVTARKTEESILEVPVAVTAFSARDIEALGHTDLGDIARFTPGFSLNSALGRQPASYRPVFRGVTTVRNGVTNANAGNTFVDGVYVGAALLTTELDNLERVEIMRGPQSAQFGRNTYVGAVNYVTRRPSETLEGRITATGAQHEQYDVSGWLEKSLEEEVRRVHRRLVNAQARLQAATDGVDAALEQVRVGSIEYRNGRTTAFELVRLGTDVASSQERYSQALVSAAKAAAELRYLTSGAYAGTVSR